MKTAEEIRQYVDQLIAAKGLNYRIISKEMGKAESYMQQYVKRGYPNVLKERERNILARILDIPEQELANFELSNKIGIKPIFKIGYVQAGKFNDACQLPEDEWVNVPYPVDNLYKNAHIFALGVRGNSMNKIFKPDITTLICCPYREWLELHPNADISGKYIIAYRKNSDGCEATVKKFYKSDEKTVLLVAESYEQEWEKPIILTPDNNEYEIAAVVISYMQDCE